ncbi:hypothetical protein BN2475_80004 [Paraburkholderia ribeironis]|uniref:Uncharacterized protein n=1 Tax=Paraburkholderia ribeironis TaxID=1247936 RepID=A0A1N7RM40_9BURK|nr:hypothetical protein BN2475_80004 [Paraburkholderia ribeironis]
MMRSPGDNVQNGNNRFTSSFSLANNGRYIVRDAADAPEDVALARIPDSQGSEVRRCVMPDD